MLQQQQQLQLPLLHAVELVWKLPSGWGVLSKLTRRPKNVSHVSIGFAHESPQQMALRSQRWWQTSCWASGWSSQRAWHIVQ